MTQPINHKTNAINSLFPTLLVFLYGFVCGGGSMIIVLGWGIREAWIASARSSPPNAVLFNLGDNVTGFYMAFGLAFMILTIFTIIWIAARTLPHPSKDGLNSNG
jgi:hypothetical protein